MQTAMDSGAKSLLLLWGGRNRKSLSHPYLLPCPSRVHISVLDLLRDQILMFITGYCQGNKFPNHHQWLGDEIWRFKESLGALKAPICCYICTNWKSWDLRVPNLVSCGTNSSSWRKKIISYLFPLLFKSMFTSSQKHFWLHQPDVRLLD